MNYNEYITDIIKESIELKTNLLSTGVESKISAMAEVIFKALQNNNKLLLCGNGGSAADAQHLAAELVVRLRSNINRRALPAISLAMDSSAITACANDFSFDEIFVRSLEALSLPGDVLLAISTSGNSENVKRALIKAKSLGVTSCAFLGVDGGAMKGIADIEFIVPSKNTARVQEVHIMLGHALMEIVEELIIS